MVLGQFRTSELGSSDVSSFDTTGFPVLCILSQVVGKPTAIEGEP